MKLLSVVAFISSLLFLAIASFQLVNFASANWVPPPLSRIYIRNDGVIVPSYASIQRVGNVYTLTGNISGYVIEVQRNDIVIDGAGFTLLGNGYHEGIILTGLATVTIKNMEIREFDVGIFISNTLKSIIYGTNISNNFYGIQILDHSKNNTISENRIASNHYGIFIQNSGNNILRNNVIIDNKRNFAVTGWTSDEINIIDSSNTVNGKPIYYWVNQRNREVPSNAGYVALINCTNITVQNQDLSENEQGLLLVWTTNSSIIKNRVANNEIGLYLASSSNNSIIENIITGNHDGGIHIEESNNNDISKNDITNNLDIGVSISNSSASRITENTITANSYNGIKISNNSSKAIIFKNYIASNREVAILVADSFENKIVGNNVTENWSWGIQLRDAQKNNTVYHNNFINNRVIDSLQVSMPSPVYATTWDDGKEGNYWSDYLTRYPNATEINGLGIGDTPFYINENNIDRYPLMKPVTNPEFPTVQAPVKQLDSLGTTLPMEYTYAAVAAIVIVLAVVTSHSLLNEKNACLRLEQSPPHRKSMRAKALFIIEAAFLLIRSSFDVPFFQEFSCLFLCS